jgi:hypothetical protein
LRTAQQHSEGNVLIIGEQLVGAKKKQSYCSVEITNMSIAIPEPEDHDVLCGRGRGQRDHLGNSMFLDLIRENLDKYGEAIKGDKMNVVLRVIETIRSRNGRFLEKLEDGWRDIGDAKAIIKTSQAFRDEKKPKKSPLKTYVPNQEMSVPVPSDLTFENISRLPNGLSPGHSSDSETETEDSFPVFYESQNHRRSVSSSPPPSNNDDSSNDDEAA